ncbi:helix-turn-helix transcriptional regulator [Streptomyces mexicanus]|jgi:hypothetical protein|uniref:helix-turn-helix transcriptional regulator n=1 Tax=Streptomyces mexicanus TaxID=178566 RepID=UPI000A8DB74E
MDALARLIQKAMRHNGMSAERLAVLTGIRAPRVKAFAEDGANGPVRPTDEELVALATKLSLPTSEVLAVAHPQVTVQGTPTR